jgi:hypothetical protein
MNADTLCDVLQKICDAIGVPAALQVEYDMYGQLVIYTGMQEVNDELIRFD